MRTAVERGAGVPLLARSAAPAGLAAAAAAVLLGTAVLRGGSVLSAGSAALLLALAAGIPVLAGRAPRPELGRAGLGALALLTAFVAWNGISVLWSALPDRTWDYLNLGLVYLAFAAGGILVGGLVPRGPRATAAAFAVVLGAACVWALAGKVFPGLYPDYERVARLRAPVGYWNALALLGAYALPLALWIAGRRAHRPAARAGGVLLLYAWSVAILLTYSRGGVLVAALVVVAWLALDPARLESLAALGLGAVPALAVGRIAFGLPGVTNDGESAAARAADGHLFGIVLVSAGAGVAVAAWWLARVESRAPLALEHRRLAGRLLVAAAGVAAVALLAAAAVNAPRFWDEFTSSSPLTSSTEHFASANANFRTRWWKQAAHGFAENPLAGSGAGSFRYWNRKLRTTTIDSAVEPHDLPLQFLAETGIVGFLLAAGAAGLGLLVVWRRIAAEEADRGAALALGLVPAAYLVHALLDYDWDYVAVTGPAFFAGGVLLARPGPVPGRSLVGGVAAVSGAAAVFLSLLLPWLAQRNVLEAFGEPPARVLPLARQAHALDPLLVDPLFQQAEAQYALGNERRAWELYLDAASTQPSNSETWLRLGQFEFESLGCPQLAYRHLRRYVELNPQNENGGLFENVLAAVNAGGARC